jgi:hypothetical protein
MYDNKISFQTKHKDMKSVSQMIMDDMYSNLRNQLNERVSFKVENQVSRHLCNQLRRHLYNQVSRHLYNQLLYPI